MQTQPGYSSEALDLHPALGFPSPSRPIAATASPALTAEMRLPVALVAVDDVVVLALLTAALQAAGWTVAVARDGIEALRTLDNQSFQLLILELNLPRRTGWEVLQGVGRLTRPRPKVLVTTVQQGPRLESQVRACGADDFVARPFALDQLRARLERLHPAVPREVPLA